MLVRFNVKNFLSFSESEDGKSVEYSMIAGKVRNKKAHVYEGEAIKLLKFSALYGANASGKSNFVKALNFMREIVLFGLPKGHTEKYCKINESNKEKESYFEVEFLINDKVYAYGFEVILSQSKFISEWLLELGNDNKEKIIFTRDINERVYTLGEDFKQKGLKTKLNVYAEDIQQDHQALLLMVMNQNKKTLYTQYEESQIFQKVYTWFSEQLDINFPNQPISDYSYMINNDNMNDIYQFLSAFGTGITGFEPVQVPVDTVLLKLPKEIRNELLKGLENKVATMKDKEIAGVVMRTNQDFFFIEVNKDEEIICTTVKFAHGKNDVLFDLSEESDGTLRILDLLEILIAPEEKTYVIDELDRCLHPCLTYQFIKTFLTLAAKRNIQLIVTTHESRLLDFDLLRRDEIWFVNKKQSGESNMYSLEEYNTRFDQKVDKAYLEGRYGGVPLFSTLFSIDKGV